ncbi:hypothetical protein l13_09750 [Neisseria weaveri ATCC 51223]|nr:hypothetical protein l13_09750 [Neisseria weaveri ATCC 51223]
MIEISDGLMAKQPGKPLMQTAGCKCMEKDNEMFRRPGICFR